MVVMYLLVPSLFDSHLDFSYIVAVTFIGGGNRRTQGKPPTYRKSLTNFII
jgi:hypothetical protein